MNFNKEYLIRVYKGHKVVITSFVGLIILFTFLSFERSAVSEKQKEEVRIDTVIPKGMILFPIELSNQDAISSIIKKYGVIDLYVPNSKAQGLKKVLQAVKIMRAPNNNNLFAVLISDQEATVLNRYSPPFIGVVLNLNTTKTGLLETNQSTASVSKTVRIEYQKEN